MNLFMLFSHFSKTKRSSRKIKKNGLINMKEQFKEHQDFINLINDFNKHSLPKHPVLVNFLKKFTYIR